MTSAVIAAVHEGAAADLDPQEPVIKAPESRIE
jgi:hypothetical protein